MVKKIAIVGAGVVGLSCAVKIAEYLTGRNIEVNLLSEEFSPNTTGDGSAGLWSPYLIGDTAPDKILKWSKETHAFFYELWNCGKAAEAGVCLQPVTRFTADLNPFWSQVVFGCTKLSYEQVDYYNKEHSRNYTSWNDPKMKPIRGQVTRVKAPWNFQTFLDDADDGNYIITNKDTVVLGGTHQENDFNKNVSAEDSDFIRNGCLKLVPSLKNAPVIKEWVGLRPGRDVVRIEEEIFLKNNGSTGKFIHNYGHGGSGVTIAWGCATDVLNLVKNNIEKDVSNAKSKL